MLPTLCLGSVLDWKQHWLLEAAPVPLADRLEPEDWEKPPRMEEVRALKAWLSLSSQGAGRVAALASFELASREVQNALLKTLEEPSEGVRLYLYATKPQVLPTIRSRVQVRVLGEAKSDLASKMQSLRLPEELAALERLVDLAPFVHATAPAAKLLET